MVWWTEDDSSRNGVATYCSDVCSDVWHCNEKVGIATDVAVPEGSVLSQIKHKNSAERVFPQFYKRIDRKDFG